MRVCLRCLRRFLALCFTSLAITSGYFVVFYVRTVVFSDLEENSFPGTEDIVLSSFDNRAPERRILQESTDEKGQECIHPKLDIWNTVSASNFLSYTPITCTSESNWVYVKNGTFHISQKAVEQHGDIKCAYGPIVRNEDDLNITTGKAIHPWLNNTKINSDFFRIKCLANDGTKHANIHSGIAYKAEVHDRKQTESSDSLGLNVLMFGFDSMSRVSWIRNLPETYHYFTQVLHGVVLEGYNIVGDGTPQALLPILTGHTEAELPEARRGQKKASMVDGHPWIWKDFQKHGYVTQWGEDGAAFGTFQYRMKGFKNQPTDHYMRPFYLSIEKLYHFFRPYCIGSIPRHMNMLNWIKDLYHMYPNRRKFSFLFHSELSHDSSDMIQATDPDLKQFLQYLEVSNHLNNTMLIMMADHGPRYQSARKTVQGKYEERMPYFSIRLPPWFLNKHPDIAKNLQINSQRLTTPFDIHETFKDVLNYRGSGKGKVTERGISLFKEIPKERSCTHAHIAPHWCACLKWETVDISETEVKRAGEALVDAINTFTESHRKICETITLDKVLGAVRYAPNDNVLKFKQSSYDGREADLSDKMSASEILYQVTVLTSPNGGKYEATVKHILKEYKFVISDKEISRINRYGNQPHCIMNELPQLRPYCYCRSQLST